MAKQFFKEVNKFDQELTATACVGGIYLAQKEFNSAKEVISENGLFIHHDEWLRIMEAFRNLNNKPQLIEEARCIFNTLVHQPQDLRNPNDVSRLMTIVFKLINER